MEEVKADSKPDELQHEVELDGGRKFLFREFRVEDLEMATTLAARTAGENPLLLSMATQQELLKLLLIAIDGKKLTNTEKEGIKRLISAGEYLALAEVTQQLLGKQKVVRLERVRPSGAN